MSTVVPLPKWLCYRVRKVFVEAEWEGRSGLDVIVSKQRASEAEVSDQSPTWYCTEGTQKSTRDALVDAYQHRLGRIDC